jgi:Do/DeqQ family serine protease
MAMYQKRDGVSWWGVVLIVAIGMGVCAGVMEYRYRTAGPPSYTRSGELPQPVLLQASNETTAKALTLGTNFEQAAGRSVDAVVYIQTRTSPEAESGFWGEGRQSTGSGVIISPNGYIVTNFHVIEGASEVSVTLNDGSEYPAVVVGQDPSTDLAVLHIEAEELPALAFGNSDDVRVGQWVLAVGNPFSLNSTVTAGIVSAKARNIGVLSSQLTQSTGISFAIESFIQTDAAVNPGNSGGALVNLDGQLVGINTAIATETGSFAGYSFAIPANLVKKISGDLMQYGVVQRGFLGVTITDVTPQQVRERRLGVRKGAYVSAVTPTGAARQAGLQAGDVIVVIEDKPVLSSSALQEVVALYSPGQSVRITYMRGESRHTVSLTLRNKNGTTERLRASAHLRENRWGIELTELSEPERSLRSVSTGLCVRGIEPSSPFAQAGVPHGFIILKANNQSVKSCEDLYHYLNTEPKLILEGLRPDGRRAYYVLAR